jgi:hypothetical protein
MQNILAKRFEELTKAATEIDAKCRPSSNYSEEVVDHHSIVNWKVKAKNLLKSACGPDSVHMQEFVKSESYSMFALNNFKRMQQVLAAAKDDYEGGYLSSVRTLVQAEVFSSELEQAIELLGKKYKAPAAVIAGTVLETGLRELCDRNNVPHGKLDKMNADLAKKGIYTVLMQKRITTLADIRNNAAHGYPDQFNDDDVKGMIADVERFLADYLS